MNQERLIASLKEIERLVADCLVVAGDSTSAKRKTIANLRPAAARRSSSQVPDFRSPIRFFMNQYAKEMNGQQTFTLVLAYISKGKVKTEVKLETIKEAWSGMKGLLGKFNTGYATWAKDKGWVDSTKARVYVLLPGWTEILNDNA